MAKTFFTPARGVNLDEQTGKLYLFEPESIQVLKAWPPQAWCKTAEKGWHRIRSNISIPRYNVEKKINTLQAMRDLPDSYRSKKMAWLKWYATIPEEARNPAAQFSSRQWHLLSFLASCATPAFDLVNSNPALAYALASNWIFHQPAVRAPLRSARTLLSVGKSQKDALGWLGFPSTEATRKAIAKVPASTVSVSRLLFLRTALQSPRVLKKLGHLEVVNAGVLRLLCDPDLTDISTPKLLGEISLNPNERDQAQSAYVLKDVIRLWRFLYAEKHFTPSLSSITKLKGLHDELSEQSQRIMNVAGEKPVSFPTPPVQGNDFIVPITDSRMLWQEAKEQHNCVFEYLNDIVITQKIYLYQVHTPQRCTLALEKNSLGWSATHLKAECNTPALQKSELAIKPWLHNQGVENSLGQCDYLDLCI